VLSQFANQWETYEARGEVVAATLTSKCNWKAGEAGFDESDRQGRIRRHEAAHAVMRALSRPEMFESESTEALGSFFQGLSERGARYPRDPFENALTFQFLGIPVIEWQRRARPNGACVF
jgi:hypothetical protein